MHRTAQSLAAILCALAITACSDNSDNNPPSPSPQPSPQPPPQPAYEFSAADETFQDFLDESETFDGISYTVVETDQGTVHEAAFGDHTLETVVMLASTSKVPSVSLLMALQDNPDLDFDMGAPIGDYLPWDGVYGDRSTAQLVSNTSGIPGLSSLDSYGAHLCQYSYNGTLEACAETLFTTELPDSQPAGTVYDYGGSQWQLAGAVAEQVSNSSWRQAFDAYIAGPCELELFQYGNMWSDLAAWNGSPDSLLGLDNPNIEGGAISSLSDYAKILLLHLRGGLCGKERVLSEAAVAAMREDRGGQFGTPYGMGWWIQTPEDPAASPTMFYDPGAFGAVAWIDIERGIGGYVAIDDYSRTEPEAPVGLVLDTIIPLVAGAVDEARAAVGD